MYVPCGTNNCAVFWDTSGLGLLKYTNVNELEFLAGIEHFRTPGAHMCPHSVEDSKKLAGVSYPT